MRWPDESLLRSLPYRAELRGADSETHPTEGVAMHWFAATGSVLMAIGVPGASQRPSICRYRVDYRGALNRIEVTHRKVTHTAIPVTAVGWITVRVTDTTDGRTMDLQVDSLTMSGADGRPSPDGGGGDGSRWHGVLTAEGRVVSLRSPELTPSVRPLDRYVRFFFPPTAVSRGARVERVDTTAWTSRRGRENTAERFVTRYAAPQRARRSGSELLVVGATWSGSRSGSVPAGPEEMSVEGTSAGRAEYYYSDADVCPAGAWRAGTSTQTSMAPAFDAPLTIENSESLTVTRLP